LNPEGFRLSGHPRTSFDVFRRFRALRSDIAIGSRSWQEDIRAMAGAVAGMVGRNFLIELAEQQAVAEPVPPKLFSTTARVARF
jgi:hypothetical protein